MRILIAASTSTALLTAPAQAAFLDDTVAACAEPAAAITDLDERVRAAGWTPLDRKSIPDVFGNAMIWFYASQHFVGDADQGLLTAALERSEGLVRGLRHKVDGQESTMRLYLDGADPNQNALIVYLRYSPRFVVIECQATFAGSNDVMGGDFIYQDEKMVRRVAVSDPSWPSRAVLRSISLDRESLKEKSGRNHVPQTVLSVHNAFRSNEVPQ